MAIEKSRLGDLTAEDAEDTLIIRAREGDPAAWEVLVRTYQEHIFRLAYLTLQDAAEAEDVAQEAFLRAYLALDRFELGRPVRPWLTRIAINLARNRRRSLGRYLKQLRGAFASEPEPERQMDGIRKAKERGVQFGKKKKLSPQQIAELQSRRQQGDLIKTLMKDYDLSKASVYRYLSEPVPIQSTTDS